MQTYRFDPNTKEYLHSEAAFRDPLESKARGKDVWLLPAESTFTAPLDPKDGYAVCWNDRVWEYVEDHRQKQDRNGLHPTGQGTAYWMPEDTWESPARYMAELGPLPEGAILVKPEKPLDVMKTEKLESISSAFKIFYNTTATLVSSLGFEADSDSRAKQDVDGLVEVLEATGDESTMFRGADNQLYPLTLAQLKVLRLEIIQNGQNAYATKWGYESAVADATTEEELDAIDIHFTGLNFQEAN